MTDLNRKYKTMSQAPVGWRTVRGVPLQLFQLNSIIELAEQSDDSFPAALGKFRAEFERTHVIENGQWAPKEIH
jgi:hypothetical protein